MYEPCSQAATAHVVLSHLLIQHVAAPVNYSPRQPAILQFSFADRGIQGLNLYTHSVKNEEKNAHQNKTRHGYTNKVIIKKIHTLRRFDKRVFFRWKIYVANTYTEENWRLVGVEKKKKQTRRE